MKKEKPETCDYCGKPLPEDYWMMDDLADDRRFCSEDCLENAITDIIKEYITG